MLDGIKKAVGEAVGEAVDTVKGAFSDDIPQEIKDANEFYDAALHDQKPYHRIWYRNLAFYMGLQWMDWSDGRNWLMEPPAPSWRVRMVTNLIMPHIRTEAAKILKSNPQIYTIPGASSEQARDAARVGNRLFEAYYYEDNFQRLNYNNVMWLLSCGSSFLWDLYDGTAGKSWSDVMKDPATGLPMMGPDGMPVMKEYFEGACVNDVSSPFETLLEPGASEDFNEHQRIMRCKVLDLDYIKDKYGVEVEADDFKAENLYQMRIANLSTFNGEAMLPRPARDTKKLALVKMFWERPTGKNPNGRYYMYAGKKFLVEPEDLDYWYDGKRALPCAKFDHITVPGRAWGMSIIEQIAQLNVFLNKMDSAVVENMNLQARPKILAPKGCLDDEAWTTEPGEIVEYTPIGGLRPEAFKPPEMPQYFMEMKNSIPSKIQDVTGIYDVSRGQLPRRATSGKAIDLLQEADDSRIGLTIKNYGSSMSRVMSIKLCTIQKKYSEQRLAKKIGEDHEVELIQFRGTDLRDLDTVRVVMGPSMTRGQKISLGLQLAEQGLVPKDMALKVMELGDLNMIYDHDQPQAEYARFENFGMAKGIMYKPALHEPHQVHHKAHQEFINSDVFRNLPPQVQQIIVEHDRMHLQMDAMTMGGQMPNPPATGGAGPAPISGQGSPMPGEQAPPGGLA